MGFKIDRAKAWDMFGQASRSTSSWLRSSSHWRWRYPHIEASWRTRRRGLKGAGQLNHVDNNILTLARTKFRQNLTCFDNILIISVQRLVSTNFDILQFQQELGSTFGNDLT